MKLERIIAVRNSKTVYRDEDTCIKVFGKDYSKSDVLNEALNQARLEDTGINVPKIHEVTVIEGKWAIVSDYIKGKSLAQLMEEDAENKDKYLEMLVDLQIKVQSERCPLLSRLKEKLNMRICQSKLDATTRFDLHTRLEKMARPDQICHGDFNPSNIIITESGEVFILDWSHATQGNGSADAAITYLLFLVQGDNESAEKYLDMYCEKTETEKDYIFKWMPIVAAAQSVRYKDKDEEMLLSWVTNQKEM